MPARSLSAAIVLLAALAFSAPALAHPQVHGQIFIGDGPLSIGVNLGHWLHYHGHHHRRHVHGPACYRSYGHGHSHWSRGHDFRGPPPWAHDRHRHRPHRQHYRHERPRHRSRHEGWAAHAHRHTRDCHLHYPRGHEHWDD